MPEVKAYECPYCGKLFHHDYDYYREHLRAELKEEWHLLRKRSRRLAKERFAQSIKAFRRLDSFKLMSAWINENSWLLMDGPTVVKNYGIYSRRPFNETFKYFRFKEVGWAREIPRLKTGKKGPGWTGHLAYVIQLSQVPASKKHDVIQMWNQGLADFGIMSDGYRNDENQALVEGTFEMLANDFPMLMVKMKLLSEPEAEINL